MALVSEKFMINGRDKLQSPEDFTDPFAVVFAKPPEGPRINRTLQ